MTDCHAITVLVLLVPFLAPGFAQTLYCNFNGSCPKPIQIDNGRCVAQTAFPDRQYYSCYNGYMFTSNPVIDYITCNPNSGTWSDYPRCVNNLYQPCVPLPNGVKTVSPSTAKFYPGDSYTYKCLDGFTPQGPLFRTCTSTGSWSSPPPTCQGAPAIRSCKQHFLSIGQTTPTAADVPTVISPDGINVLPVFCQRTDTSTITKVVPTAASASQTRLTSSCIVANNIPTDLSVLPAGYTTTAQTCSNAFQLVIYSGSFGAIDALQASIRSCVQKLTWTCSGTVPALSGGAPNNLFIGVTTNDQPMSTVYNLLDPDFVGTTEVTIVEGDNMRSTNGQCDCVKQGCALCNCAKAPLTAQTTDTITLRNKYVTGTIMGIASTVIGLVAQQTVSVGNIECSEMN